MAASFLMVLKKTARQQTHGLTARARSTPLQPEEYSFYVHSLSHARPEFKMDGENKNNFGLPKNNWIFALHFAAGVIYCK